VAWVLLTGAVVGSFLNVVIARVPVGKSVVHPPSHCPRCGARIAWYDNVPILSFLLLRARCRACRAPISWRYPLVEALGALAALAAFERHGFSAGAAAEFAAVAMLIALAMIDLDTWLLPNAITWPLIALGAAMGALGLTPAGSLRSASFGAGLGFGAFALVAWLGEKAFKKEALGFGDVWLLAGLGAWMGVAALLPIVLLASIQGSVVGLALIALGKGQPGPGDAAREPPPPAAETEMETEASSSDARLVTSQDDWVPAKHAVPFGPFLVAAALEWLWLGDLIVRAVPVLRIFR
jgi:leader peptidase (prepilin peptidase)/N-methyltransferase